MHHKNQATKTSDHPLTLQVSTYILIYNFHLYNIYVAIKIIYSASEKYSNIFEFANSPLPTHIQPLNRTYPQSHQIHVELSLF